MVANVIGSIVSIIRIPSPNVAFSKSALKNLNDTMRRISAIKYVIDIIFKNLFIDLIILSCYVAQDTSASIDGEMNASFV